MTPERIERIERRLDALDARVPPESHPIILQTKKGRCIPTRYHREVSFSRLKEAAKSLQDKVTGRYELRSLGGTYNCIGMIVANRRAAVQAVDLIWILRDDGYQEISKNAALVGDVVVYRKEGICNGEVVHAGIIIARKDTDDGPVFCVLSQWDGIGEFDHDEHAVPQPDYGKPTDYWTHRKLPIENT